MADVPEQVFIDAAEAYDLDGFYAKGDTLDLAYVVARSEFRAAVASAYRAGQASQPSDLARRLNGAMVARLRRCAADTSPNWDGAVTVYPPGARELVALIDSLLAAATPDGPRRWALPDELRGDGPCGDCGTLNNIVWFTESVFWNDVVRRVGSDAILCIPCFVIRADAAGYFPTGWRLLPDWHWETKTERERRLADATPAADGDRALGEAKE